MTAVLSLRHGLQRLPLTGKTTPQVVSHCVQLKQLTYLCLAKHERTDPASSHHKALQQHSRFHFSFYYPKIAQYVKYWNVESRLVRSPQ